MEWKNDVLSFSGFDYGVSKENRSNGDKEKESEKRDENKASPTLQEICNSKYETVPEEDEMLKQCEFDAMSERKIENFYFQNIEQAERKMKKLTMLKTKWSEPRKKGVEIVAKACLKPISQENPWKDGTIREMEVKEKSERRCIIS